MENNNDLMKVMCGFLENSGVRLKAEGKDACILIGEACATLIILCAMKLAYGTNN